MGNNRRRMLAEVLSIDAWHEPFRTDGRTSSVHVEVSFQQGRLGGDDPNMPFTFRVNLKRALLTVRLESPLILDRASVGRSIPSNPIELSTLLAARNTASSARENGGEINALTIATALGRGTSGSESDAAKSRMQIVQQYPRILVTAKPRGSQEYAWDLTPTYEDYLEGQPWDPIDAPRMSVEHPFAKPAITPSVKVTLSCALDDISITELEPKNSGLFDRLKSSARNEISEAVAIQYLKLVLRDSDLEVGELDNRFSNMLIADIFATESR